MNFEESILLPKVQFESLVKNKEDHGDMSGGGGRVKKIFHKKTPPLKKKECGPKPKKKNFLAQTPPIVPEQKDNLEFLSYIQKKRQQMNNSEKPTGLLTSAVGNHTDLTKPIAVMHTEKDDTEKLDKFFPPDDRFKVYRILSILKNQSHDFKWDPKSFEITLNGEFLPGSNIIDIISYLLGLNADRWSSEDPSLLHTKKLAFQERAINL